MIVFLFLFAIAHATTVQEEEFRKLTCDADLIIGETILPDTDYPSIIHDRRGINILAKFNTAEYLNYVYIDVNIATFYLYATDDTGAPVGTNLTYATATPLIVVKKGEYPDCLGVPGCDGLILSTLQMIRHFGRTAVDYHFELTLKFSKENTTILTHAPVLLTSALKRNSLQAATPATASLIDETNVQYFQMKVAKRWTYGAFNSGQPVDDNFAIVAGVMGGVIVLAMVGMVAMAMMYPAIPSSAAAAGSTEMKSLIRGV